MNKQMTRSKAAVISTNEYSIHQSKRNKERNAETEGSSEIRMISEEGYNLSKRRANRTFSAGIGFNVEAKDNRILTSVSFKSFASSIERSSRNDNKLFGKTVFFFSE
jgi:hypothetical protein